MTAMVDYRTRLIHLLHMAYSGEKAAGYAYAAHWRSLRDAEERRQIQKIESEEWTHRAIVGDMLKFLGSKPQLLREIWMAIIGRTVGFGCFLIGRFLPMYFAGRLESANIKEYEHASEYAAHLGLHDFADELMRLSDVEKEHEQYFMNAVRDHRFLPFVRNIFQWGPAAEIQSVPVISDDQS